MDRRTFLQAGAAGLLIQSTGGFAKEMLNVKPTYGLIGCGWYGKSAMLRLLQVAPAEVVALCDVDRQMVEEAATMAAERQVSKRKPRIYHDYREMLAKEKLDIVQVSTPDHWHALAMIEAVKAGADVYVEKPISVDVVEGQAMLAAARKYKRVVQVGMQRRSTPHLIEARDRILNEGKLGKIGHVEVYCYYHMRNGSNPPDSTPPDHLDYEMWTGPAPLRPYSPICHPRGWRAFMEYGNGIMGDMCVHMYDMVRWLLDLGWPQSISSTGGTYLAKGTKANIADTQTAIFKHDDLDVVWQHRTWGASADPQYPWGATIYGEKGTLKLSVMGYDFIPQGQGEAIHQDVAYEYDEYPEDRTEKDLERHVAAALRGHMRNFLQCIDSRGKPVSDIEQGYISSSSCILANLAMQTGRTLAYDPSLGQIVGDEEANRLLLRPYRNPWVHPDPKTV
ncbi:MAG: Gfo/Idh/MocA family oxidoreductase [bacterium]|jgi:predicted dehydrogenase|nr:Gfo/Idh/MocA family oxidoreductase [bacterium]